jgi:16S rRNA (uracil1498-N3)-methyltransferase
MKSRDARIPRLHLEQPLGAGASLELADPAAHHVLHVLRLRAGESVILFDGQGGEWDGEVVAAHRGRVAVRAGEWRDIERESPLAVTLVQGIASGDRMDFTVQKAVELGVAAIQPLLTARSVVRLTPERGEARRAHWRRIAIAACEQCGRNRVPEIRKVTAIANYCAGISDPMPRLALSPRAQTGLREAGIAPGAALTVAIGPESGFSVEEEALLARAGFQRVRLGPRVLRTETAAPAALAALNALAGDF